MVETEGSPNEIISLSDYSDSCIYEYLSYLLAPGEAGEVTHIRRRWDEEDKNYVYVIDSEISAVINLECRCRTIAEAIVIFAITNQYLLESGVNYIPCEDPLEELIMRSLSFTPTWDGGSRAFGDLRPGLLVPVYADVQFIEDDVRMQMPDTSTDALCEVLERVIDHRDGIKFVIESPNLILLSEEDVSEYYAGREILAKILDSY